jgi:hypothetical protein
VTRVHERLPGSWTLESYVTEHPDGTRGKPFGDARGRLAYDGHGHMAGQVMRPDREKVGTGEPAAAQARAAYVGYIAYYGTY